LDLQFGPLGSRASDERNLEQILLRLYPLASRQRDEDTDPQYARAQLAAHRADAARQLAGELAGQRTHTLEEELDAYLKIGVVSAATVDTAAGRDRFVQDLDAGFRRIARAIRMLSTIQMSSSESERVFSETGHVVTKLRTRLAAETAEALVMLNRNARPEAPGLQNVSEWAAALQEALNPSPAVATGNK
jgi:hypothetical protein